MPVEQDENGTYILSSKDLCLIKELPEIVEMGIDSLKIEGRLKTEYYVATVINAYRNAIDDYIASVSLIQSGLKEVFAEISLGLQQYSTTAKEGLQQMLDPFTSSVTDASEQIANSITPLNDAVSDLSEFGDSIHGLLGELNKTLKPLEKSIENLNKFKEILKA